MVFIAQIFSDLLKRYIDHFPAKKHNNLSGIGDVSASLGGSQISGGDIKMIGNDFNNPFRRYLNHLIGGYVIAQNIDSHFQIDFLAVQTRKGHQFRQGALQFPDVGLYIFCDR